LDFLEWWRSVYRSKQPEPAEPMMEPMTSGPNREMELGFMVRVWENGQDVTDLVRSFSVKMNKGDIRRGSYIVDMGSGMSRTVAFNKDDA
jgi:hypothetical protein